MGTFQGFDIDRLGALKKNLATASSSAGTLSSSVANLVSQAMTLQLGSAAGPLERGNGPWSGSTDANRKGLTALAADGPGMSAEIGRRTAHLMACQQLVVHGFVTEPDVAFADEPPPSEANIKAALEQVRHSLTVDPGFNGNHDDMQRILAALQGLSGTELEAVLGNLSDAELMTLNSAISKGDGMFSSNGLDPDETMTMASLFNSHLGEQALARIERLVTNLEPDINIDMKHSDVSFKPVTGELYTDGVSPDDIHQGNAGDCWFMSSLAVVAQSSPGWIQSHIQSNDNGTWTVTMYRDGKPVEITVDNEFPQRGSDFAMSHGSSSWSADGASDLWVAIYEKAFAQYKSSYGSTEGGWGYQGMPVITGQSASKLDTFVGGNFDLIKAELADGRLVTAGTGDDKTLGLWGDSDDRMDGGQLVSHHEYYVAGFTDDGKIILKNPWGSGAGAPQTVTLTQDQFDDYVDGVSIGGGPS